MSHPKPSGLLKYLVRAVTGDGDTVLDFFAGSGTTAHGVWLENIEDGNGRRFILVQLPEALDAAAQESKSAFEFCREQDLPPNIAEICKERLRRTAKKLREESPLFSGDFGFRVFKLASSNIREWEPDRDDLHQSLVEAAEHLKTDRTEADILFELLLKLGLDLTVPIEVRCVVGKTVHSIGAGTILVCLTPQIAATDVEPLALGLAAWHKELAPAGESEVVFRDSAFGDDVAKTNLTAILQQYGLENVRSL
jgi:adenine-specific DNA-methyltransferase